MTSILRRELTGRRKVIDGIECEEVVTEAYHERHGLAGAEMSTTWDWLPVGQADLRGELGTMEARRCR